MFHPFSEDTSALTVAQLHDKISELTHKYFSTSNPQVQEQISTFIDFYRQEALVKEAKEKLEQEKNQQNGDLGLDKLIKVS
jgi:hypothetical protein|tara:strand:- start:174 stop:416 length:243 start_codon:yes stop_codon:yes gene_type:complete